MKPRSSARSIVIIQGHPDPQEHALAAGLGDMPALLKGVFEQGFRPDFGFAVSGRLETPGWRGE